jgi:carbamoyl-phosphate synthase small subunit
MNKKLVLENGKVFYGQGFGSDEKKIAEIVFNTSMVGYQEIMSDPSYCDQFVVMTYPLIGNYGLTSEDYESNGVYMSGFIVHEYNDIPSNFRFTETLGDKMKESHAVGISGVDTREITRIIRDCGSMKAMICDASYPLDKCLEELASFNYRHDQVSRVSTKKVWYSRCQNYKFTVVAIDCGCKLNIIRMLNQFKCNVVVVPFDTTAEKILSYKPDGLFISNGPGDPEDAKPVIELVRQCKGKLPIFGICLGHQIISLACGAKTYKLKFGHRGANHAIKNLLTNRLEITSQNHSYAVDDKSIKGTDLEVTHINMLDNTIEGVRIKKDYLFSVQYHPEAAAGPEDSEYLFGVFIDNMKKFKEAK